MLRACLLVLSLFFATLAYAAQPISESHELYIPYWTSEAGWGTEFQLKNNLSSQPLAVTQRIRW